MVRMPWATYLWPGLPQLWCQGNWSALALAVAFGGLVNCLLMASLVWVEVLSPGMLRLAWLAMGLIWVGCAVGSAWYGGGVSPRRASSAEAMFREALSEYLQGNWFEAERILGELLHMQPRDVEARLLLATLLRHNARPQEAAEQLTRLALLEDSRRWAAEINAERRAIAELLSTTSRASQTESAVEGDFSAEAEHASDDSGMDLSEEANLLRTEQRTLEVGNSHFTAEQADLTAKQRKTTEQSDESRERLGEHAAAGESDFGD